MKTLLKHLLTNLLTIVSLVYIFPPQAQATSLVFDGSYIPLSDYSQIFNSFRPFTNNGDGTVSANGADAYIFPSSWHENQANDGPDQTSDIVIEFRWKDSGNSINYPAIIGAQNVGTNNLLNNYKFHFATNSDGMTLFVCDGDCNKTIIVSPLDVTQWHVYKLVKTGTTVELFVDDVSRGTQSHNPPAGLKFQMAKFGNLVPPGNYRYSYLDYLSINYIPEILPHVYSRHFGGTIAPLGWEVAIPNWNYNLWSYNSPAGITNLLSSNLESYHVYNLTNYSIPFHSDWQFTMRYKCIISPGEDFSIVRWGNGYITDLLWWHSGELQLFSSNNVINSGITCDSTFHDFEIRRQGSSYELILDSFSKGTIPAPSTPSTPTASHDFSFFHVGAMNQGNGNLSTNYQFDEYQIDIPHSFLPPNLPPVADLNGPYSALPDQTITLDASNSSDPDDNIISYEWDLDNDGEYNDATGNITAISFPNNGVYAIGLKVTDELGEFETTTTTITVERMRQIELLSPLNVWIGLKNSDSVGLKFDLMAEIYKNGTELITTGEVNHVGGGSSGFNNAHLQSISFNLSQPIDFPVGSSLSMKVFVRNTCYGNTKNSGYARLWYNDLPADSHFGATIDNISNNYYLLNGFVLSTSAGTGSRQYLDIQSGSPCSEFKQFGNWVITP